MASSSRSAGAKRLLKEYAELQAEPHTFYAAWPASDDNIFEWHFTIRGPEGTSFEEGAYHGRILLPPEYPFKPPSIIFLTPNGRFEVGKKICLSVTGHHPEFWRPAWGIRTVLVAVLSFMPTQGDGAIGALDYSDEERRALARRSRHWMCPQCSRRNIEILPDVDKETRTEDKGDSGADELISMMNFAYEGKGGAAPANGAPGSPSPEAQKPAEAPKPTEQSSEEAARQKDKGKGPETAGEPAQNPASASTSAPAPAPGPLSAPSGASPPLSFASPPAATSAGSSSASTSSAPAIRIPAGAHLHRPPHPHTPTMPTPPMRETPEEFQRRISRERAYIDAAIAVVVGLIAWLLSRRITAYLKK